MGEFLYMRVKNDPLVSVIIPVYNVAPYLKRCMDSIINQTLKNIEILAIDDGSNDGSETILDEYASKDSRVRVFHVDNGGVSKARNLGLDNAKGKYVAFIDPDDFVPLDIYECLLKEINTYNCQLVQSSIQCVYDNGISGDLVLCGERIIIKEEFLYAYRDSIITGSCCDKLFVNENIADIRFREGLPVSEDQLFVIEYLEKISRVRIIDKVGYYYYQREDSVIHETLNYKHFSDIYLFNQLVKDGVLTKKTLSGRMISIFMAKKSLSLILSMIANNIYTDRYFELRNIFIVNSKDIFTTRSVSFTNKVCAFMIWLCPKLFYRAYSLYHKLKSRRKNEHCK